MSSDARKRAEEALAKYAGCTAERNCVTCTPRLAAALRALLASEPAKVSGSVSIVRSDDPPAKPLPTCVNCGSNFITPAPPDGADVREAAERVRSLPPSTNEFNVAVANLLTALRATASPAPGSEGVREAAFAQFGRALLPLWWDDGNPGDIDGSAAQDAAEASGLWRRVERHADGVECEWCNNEEPCGELTDTGLAALRGGQKGEGR